MTPEREAWERRYVGDAYVFGEQPNGGLMRQAGHWQAGQRAVCVADGEGRNGVALARQGLQVDSFDPSPSALAKARRLAEHQGVALHLHCAGWEDFSWPDAGYDLVVAIFIQFARPIERERLFARLRQALRPGGRLLLLGYSLQQLRYGTGGPAAPEQLYTEELLREAFADLELLELKAFEEELSEGAGHAGRSALIGLVARRGDAAPSSC